MEQSPHLYSPPIPVIYPARPFNLNLVTGTVFGEEYRYLIHVDI
jgi:hypothetical protein